MLLWAAAFIGSALAADVGERERLARIDVDVWVVRVRNAPGEALEPLAECSNAGTSVIWPGRVLPVSVRGPMMAFCVQIRGKLARDVGAGTATGGGAWKPLAQASSEGASPFPDLVADLEVRDSEGKWRLIQTRQMDEFSWASERGAPQALGIIAVEHSKMEAMNVAASTEIGSPALPCSGTLRLVVRRRGANFDEVEGLYRSEPRLYRSPLYRCPAAAPARNADPAELLEGGG